MNGPLNALGGVLALTAIVLIWALVVAWEET